MNLELEMELSLNYTLFLVSLMIDVFMLHTKLNDQPVLWTYIIMHIILSFLKHHLMLAREGRLPLHSSVMLWTPSQLGFSCFENKPVTWYLLESSFYHKKDSKILLQTHTPHVRTWSIYFVNDYVLGIIKEPLESMSEWTSSELAASGCSNSRL